MEGSGLESGSAGSELIGSGTGTGKKSSPPSIPPSVSGSVPPSIPPSISVCRIRFGVNRIRLADMVGVLIARLIVESAKPAGDEGPVDAG